jgi:hypothetical protein
MMKYTQQANKLNPNSLNLSQITHRAYLLGSLGVRPKDLVMDSRLMSYFHAGHMHRRNMLLCSNIRIEDYLITEDKDEKPTHLDVVWWFSDNHDAGFYEAQIPIKLFQDFQIGCGAMEDGFSRTIDQETGESEFIKTRDIGFDEFLDEHLNVVHVRNFLSSHYLRNQLPNIQSWDID